MRMMKTDEIMMFVVCDYDDDDEKDDDWNGDKVDYMIKKVM